MRSILLITCMTALLTTAGCGSKDQSSPAFTNTKELGEALFSDTNLSFNRTQSCATCHNPEAGFVDNRSNASNSAQLAGAGSLGDDGISIGDRNAPSAAYAAFIPEFHQGNRTRVSNQSSDIGDYEGYMGGQFWDGRAIDLKEQAGGPPLNPGEMNMPDKASVIERIKENPDYIVAFETLFSANIFDDIDAAYDAFTQSISDFEFHQRDDFYPQDSKYDLSLRGEYIYDPNSRAALGKSLFFSSDLTCAACHQQRAIGIKGEMFTGFEYHNIGVPENSQLRNINGVSNADLGLALNPVVIENGDAQESKGKFKVPSLRNVAVTAPYMHNGIFNELETVIHFYEHAKLRALNLSDTSLNPETQLPWAQPEVDENINHDVLGKNDKELTSDNIEAIVCFLMTLTDKRYEHLLNANKVLHCGI